MPTPILIVGAGLAGLWTALNCTRKFPTQKIIVISAAALGKGAASAWAQGGIAAAFDEKDSPKIHTADTLKAGGAINNEKALNLLTSNIGKEIEKLEQLGIRFDRDAHNFLLSREAGHSHRRIVRSAGDMAGKMLMRGISEAVLKAEKIEVIENTIVGRLALDKNQKVAGVFARRNKGDWSLIKSGAVVLATGGIGQLYKTTTNPPQALGYGLGMAAIAGAEIADAEFVQFHPTALALGESPAPLATEALRGEGATLLDSKGHRFMLEADTAAELAPRDIVAREVAKAVKLGGAFLDATAITSVALEEHFPLICAACHRKGIDPKRDLIPITPAAHYHMGGVACDVFGRTSIDGLWVCGESAGSGAHGANRLAGNSLGEALVFASFLCETLLPQENSAAVEASLNERAAGADDEHTGDELKEIMDSFVGVLREQSGLMIALDKIKQLEKRNAGAVLNENMLVAAKMICGAALARTESRGAHWRTDYPAPDASFAHRTKWTLTEICDKVGG